MNHRSIGVLARWVPLLLAGAEMIAFRTGAGQDALVNLGALRMQRPPSFF